MNQCNTCLLEFKTLSALGSHKRIHTRTNGPGRLDFNCLNCNKEGTYDPKSTIGKFCSNACSGEFKRKQTFITVLEGKGTADSLKKYLISRDGHKCSKCKISEWQGDPISLQLDHINGNSDNNVLENGRILCPNCHSQTETFSGRNKKNTKRNSYLQRYKSEKKQK